MPPLTKWSVANPCPELGDGWMQASTIFSRARSCGRHAANKYVSPQGQTFRSLAAAQRFLGMPVVARKRSVPKSSMPKSSVPKSSVAKSSVTKKAKSSVKASVDPLPLSEYEIQNQVNIARNQAYLRELGLLGDVLGLAKKVAPRATPRTNTKVGQLGKRSSDASRPKAPPDRLDL